MPHSPLERRKIDDWDRTDRHQHQGRAVRHRRGAASHAAAEVGPLHQRLVGRRPQGRPGKRRVRGDEDRGARDLRGTSAGGRSPGTSARRSSRRAPSRRSCRTASPSRTSRRGSASSTSSMRSRPTRSLVLWPSRSVSRKTWISTRSSSGRRGRNSNPDITERSCTRAHWEKADCRCRHSASGAWDISFGYGPATDRNAGIAHHPGRRRCGGDVLRHGRSRTGPSRTKISSVRRSEPSESRSSSRPSSASSSRTASRQASTAGRPHPRSG